MYLCYNIFFNTAAVETLATMNVETGLKIWKHWSGQTLREDVHELGGHRYMQDADITDGNVFPDEVEVDLDMLGMLVLNGVGGEVDGVDIVTVDESALWQWSMDLLEELLEPTSFGHTIGHDMILSLDARAGDDVLAFGGSGDKIVAEKHMIACGGSACIRATRPVCIRVDHQLGGGGRASQVEAEVQEASQITHDALHRSEVRLPR
jgi:hypothetical protein